MKIFPEKHCIRGCLFNAGTISHLIKIGFHCRLHYSCAFVNSFKNNKNNIINPLMPGGNKKGHTYLDKPAADAERSAAGLFRYF